MKKSILFNSVANIATLSAFDNKAGWKVDDKGAIVLIDGNPVYIGPDGKEMTVQSDTVARLNDEASTSRKRYETAEEKLTKFKDIDPELARKNIATLADIDLSKMLDAGEVDKAKAEIAEQFGLKITDLETRLQTSGQTVTDMRMDAAFAGSKFIADRVSVMPSMFRGEFGRYFKEEDGKIVAFGADGARMKSVKHIGDMADFDEACEILVDGYAGKDKILKPINASGTGSDGGGGGRGNGAVVRVADFDKMSPGQQSEIAGKAAAGELSIVD